MTPIDRLALLERRVRRQQVLLVVLLGLLALGWARPDRETLELRDELDRVRLRLGWNEAGEPGMFLLDEEGVERAAFELTRNEDQEPEERVARVMLRNSGGGPSVELAHVDEHHHGPYEHLKIHGPDDGFLALLGTARSIDGYRGGELHLADNMGLGSVELVTMEHDVGAYLRLRKNERDAEHPAGESPFAGAMLLGGPTPRLLLEEGEKDRTISMQD